MWSKETYIFGGCWQPCCHHEYNLPWDESDALADRIEMVPLMSCWISTSLSPYLHYSPIYPLFSKNHFELKFFYCLKFKPSQMIENLVLESRAQLITKSKIQNWLKWDKRHTRKLQFVNQLPLTSWEEDYQGRSISRLGRKNRDVGTWIQRSCKGKHLGTVILSEHTQKNEENTTLLQKHLWEAISILFKQIWVGFYVACNRHVLTVAII